MGGIFHGFLRQILSPRAERGKSYGVHQLRKGNMMVKEYSLRFTQLARYAPHVVADNRAKMSKFMSGVNDSVVNECRYAMLNKDMTLARLMTHLNK